MERELIGDHTQIPINQLLGSSHLQIPISALGGGELSDIGGETEMG